jgi:hypothetical protein
MEIYSDGSFIAGDSTVYFSITSDISIEHKKLAKLYIEDGGLMRTRMDALGLDDDERLEELVLECERHWDSVINRIKGQAMIPDLAERSASFAYGRGVADTYSINGDAMLQAVKKMAVSTVDTMHEKVEMNGDIRARHEFVVIAMLVEALFGLQNNHVDGFRRELLGESLKKVEQYLAFEKQYGEDAVQFELRTTKSDAADREAEHAKIYKRQENDIYALKLKNKALQEKVDHNPNLPLQERGEADVQFENRTLQDKIIRIEKDRDYQVRQLDSAGKHKDDALKLLEGQCQELQHKTMRQGIKISNHTQENRQLKYENLKFRNKPEVQEQRPGAQQKDQAAGEGGSRGPKFQDGALGLRGEGFAAPGGGLAARGEVREAQNPGSGLQEGNHPAQEEDRTAQGRLREAQETPPRGGAGVQQGARSREGQIGASPGQA